MFSVCCGPACHPLTRGQCWGLQGGLLAKGLLLPGSPAPVRSGALGKRGCFSRQRWSHARGMLLPLLLPPRQQRHCDPSLCAARSSGCTRIPGVCCCWPCLLKGAWAGLKLPRMQSPPETRQLPWGLSLLEP